MRSAALWLAATLAGAPWLCAAPPSFRAEDVRPQGAAEPHPLRPGMAAWIFGESLGPSPACTVSNTMDPGTYVPELCGVQVLVGGLPARLLYVSRGQINLVLPEHAWEDEWVDVQVVRDGSAGPPVAVRFGNDRTTLAVEGPAYAGLPVWVRIERPWGLGELRYPFHTEPWDMGAVWMEVRRDGRLLEPLPLPTIGPANTPDGMRVSLPQEPPPGLLNRVPLHVLYALDQPGRYEIRFRDLRPPPPGRAAPLPPAQSAWTSLELEPATESQRAAWLAKWTAQPPADEAEIVSSYLPSLLALRDARALRALAPYLDHPNLVVRRYAGYALYYFDPALRRRVLPGREPPPGFVR
ncbi:MAG: hypothetical protein GC160_12665 [Acidobacteria bacterium]|nr:hypothetical protein [Acidobacteriota bacterium]